MVAALVCLLKFILTMMKNARKHFPSTVELKSGTELIIVEQGYEEERAGSWGRDEETARLIKMRPYIV